MEETKVGGAWFVPMTGRDRNGCCSLFGEDAAPEESGEEVEVDGDDEEEVEEPRCCDGDEAVRVFARNSWRGPGTIGRLAESTAYRASAKDCARERDARTRVAEEGDEGGSFWTTLLPLDDPR